MSRNPIALMARSQVDTAAFHTWFRESKVVDEQGRPLVVYHGTFGDFSAFSENEKGMFFAATGKRASAFLAHLSDGRNGADFDMSCANVLPVYLSLQNPLVLNAKSLRLIAKSLGRTDVEKFVANFEDSNTAERSAVREYALQHGRDGMVIARDLMPTPGGVGDWGFTKSYVAFRPEQIKSVTGNRGSYDPANPDIRCSHGFSYRERAR